MIILSIPPSFSLLDNPPEALFTPILLMAIRRARDRPGGSVLSAMAISGPASCAGHSARFSAETSAHMQIYDATELGLLRSGFNDMVREAQRAAKRMRDLFGRYVGEDVARRALERVPNSAGGARRRRPLHRPGRLHPARRNPAARRSRGLLNEFFRVVVDTVLKHGRFVNKFQGDAALCIFGAPIEHPDASARHWPPPANSTTTGDRPRPDGVRHRRRRGTAPS